MTEKLYCFVDPPEQNTHFLGSSSWTKSVETYFKVGARLGKKGQPAREGEKVASIEETAVLFD